MPKHETKSCVRRGKEFECTSGSILLRQRQCQTIYLTPNELTYITSQYDDCLRMSCLKRLKADSDIRALDDCIRNDAPW